MANTIPKVYSKYLYDIDVNDIRFKHSLTVSGNLTVEGNLGIDSITTDAVSTDNIVVSNKIQAKYFQTDNKTIYSQYLDGSEANDSVLRITVDRIDSSAANLNGAFNMLLNLHNPESGDVVIGLHGVLDESLVTGFRAQTYHVVKSAPALDLSFITYSMTASGNLHGADFVGQGYYFLKFTGEKPFHLSTVSVAHVTPPEGDAHSQLNMSDYVSFDVISDASYTAIDGSFVPAVQPVQKEDLYLNTVDIKEITNVESINAGHIDADTVAVTGDITTYNTSSSYKITDGGVVEQMKDNGGTNLANVKFYNKETFDILADNVLGNSDVEQVLFKVEVEDFTVKDYNFNMDVTIISLQYGKVDINIYASAENEADAFIYYYYECYEPNMEISSIKYRNVCDADGRYFVYFCVEFNSSSNKNYCSIKTSLTSSDKTTFHLIGSNKSLQEGDSEYIPVAGAFGISGGVFGVFVDTDVSGVNAFDGVVEEVDGSKVTAYDITDVNGDVIYSLEGLQTASLKPLITNAVEADNINGGNGSNTGGSADGVSATSLFYILDMCRIKEQSLGTILNQYSLSNSANLEKQIINAMNIYIHVYGFGINRLPDSSLNEYYHTLDASGGNTSGDIEELYLATDSASFSSYTLGKIEDFFTRFFNSTYVLDNEGNPITNREWFSTSSDLVSNTIGFLNFNLLSSNGLGLFDYNGTPVTSVFEIPKETILTDISQFIVIDTVPSKTV